MAVPCDPKWACTGNNTCATGYDGWRCSECNTCFKVNPEDKCRRYYKRAGECVECPDNPWILAAGFLLAVILACTAGYIVNKKNLHLAFLSIGTTRWGACASLQWAGGSCMLHSVAVAACAPCTGVDYFQILAIFANSRVMWPPLIKEIFHLMSVFNFNLEVRARALHPPSPSPSCLWVRLPTTDCATHITRCRTRHDRRSPRQSAASLTWATTRSGCSSRHCRSPPSRCSLSATSPCCCTRSASCAAPARPPATST